MLRIRVSLFASAIALLRPQYESLVRGIWLLYAASDNWVEKLSEPLTMESAKRANEGLRLAEMLNQLESHTAMPKLIMESLLDYKDTAWKPFTSIVALSMLR